MAVAREDLALCCWHYWLSWRWSLETQGSQHGVKAVEMVVDDNLEDDSYQ